MSFKEQSPKIKFGQNYFFFFIFFLSPKMVFDLVNGKTNIFLSFSSFLAFVLGGTLKNVK